MNLSAVDLNLLVVFHTLLADSSVARAAARLHVTPPAISNALARLRSLLGDPLFVRSGRGLVPTPRALELAPALARAMSELERVLCREPPDPAQTERQLCIALSDAEQLAALPPLSAAFLRAFPRATLRVISIDTLIAAGGLERGAADVAIGPVEAAGGYHAEPLYEEEAVLVVRKGHPAAKGKLTAERFAALRHVDIELALGRGGAGHGVAEDALAQHGLVRNIALSVPTFAAAALVVARTELVTGLPRRYFATLAPALPLVALPMPGPPLRFRMTLLWHERSHVDPVARRFRELIVEVLREPGPERPRERPAARRARSSVPD